MLLTIGATIQCLDGEAGRLKYVVVDPEKGEVTHLVVERGMLLHRDIVVPIELVDQAFEGVTVLNTTGAELNELPEYDDLSFIEPEVNYKPVSGYRSHETRFRKSPNDKAGGRNSWIARFERLGFRDDEVFLERGLPVLTRDERIVGALDHLVVEPESHRVTHLVMRWGWLWNRKARIVPLERAAKVDEAGVRLDMTAEELEQAPPYQPSPSDAQVASSLRRALEADPRTRGSGLRVDVQGGVVRFIGTVADTAMDAAREIARSIHGVTGFAYDAVAPPSPPLRIGEPVYARDGRYGTLHKVLVDPYERRVTHLIVRQGWLLGEDRVIPVERVERAEPDGIYLNAVADELDQYPRYWEEAFVEPLAGWEALEPYAVADTLFWGGPYVGVAPLVLPVVEHVVLVGVPEGEIVLRRGADVIYNEELVGSLDHVLFDPTSGQMTHLVVQDYESGRLIIIPSGWVREIYDHAITLDRWDPDQPGVPAYDADSSPLEEEDERSDQQRAAREELVDETLKQTFPASDPPFWMP